MIPPLGMYCPALKVWYLYLCVCVCPLLCPSREGRGGALSSKCYIDHTDFTNLHTDFTNPSYHLTRSKKSTLTQMHSLQRTKGFHQHGIVQKDLVINPL